MKKLICSFVTLLFVVACGNKPVPPEPVETDSLSIIESNVVDSSKVQTVEDSTTNKNEDLLLGTYYCERSRESYYFSSDNTGIFISSGRPVGFSWERKGQDVKVIFEMTGTQYLMFDENAEILKEKSDIFETTLIFRKKHK